MCGGVPVKNDTFETNWSLTQSWVRKNTDCKKMNTPLMKMDVHMLKLRIYGFSQRRERQRVRERERSEKESKYRSCAIDGFAPHVSGI